MNYFTLSLLLSGMLIASSLYPAAAAEPKETSRAVASLDDAVAVEELEPRDFELQGTTLRFDPELYPLSQFMKALTEDKDTILIGLGNLGGTYYIRTLGVTLQEIHALLSAIQTNSLQDYLDRLPMVQLLKTLELSSYLHLVDRAEDITETIANYIAKKTIEDQSPAPSIGTFCLLYTSPSPRDRTRSRMPSSA